MGGWKALSGVEELRVMGGPRRASRWGLLLRMEEVDEAGVVVVAGGAVEVMVWDKPETSWLGVPPGKGWVSKSPPNSISWLLISCSMSVKKRSHSFIKQSSRTS